MMVDAAYIMPHVKVKRDDKASELLSLKNLSESEAQMIIKDEDQFTKF